MRTYHSPLDLVRERSPERPVALVRPDAVTVAARWFQDNLKGDVLYAVKANPSPWIIRALNDAGVAGFDVASIPEIELVAEHAPSARMAFMHPVKSRSAIARAYSEFGVKTFALDCLEELDKILDATGGATDLNLIVRMSVAAEGAQYSLSGKFGVDMDKAPALLLAARRATTGLMGVSFHVGSQCMRPTAYQAAMAQCSRALVRAGVFADVVDVGGGFPSVYPGMIPPDMSEYAAAIQRGFNEMMVHETTELWCEPGRALVAEASSLLAKVELKKGDALYLNDGSYGSLFDATHSKWPFPVKLVRGRRLCQRRRAEALPLLRPDLRLHRPHARPLLAAGRRGRGRLHRDRHAGRLWRGHGHPLQRLRRHRRRRGRGRAHGLDVRPRRRAPSASPARRRRRKPARWSASAAPRARPGARGGGARPSNCRHAEGLS